MDYTKYKEWLKENLDSERYEHSLGVAECAAELAERFGLDKEKAYLCGLIHDCAKCFSNEELKEKIPYHFFQLGKGLYYGERKNGDVEVFRDLWTSNDIGIFYKNIEINKTVKTTIDIINEKLNNNELINHYSDFVN